MNPRPIDPDVLADFLAESAELIDKLEADLVGLEGDADSPGLLDKAFRGLHTLKGSALFLGLTELVDLAHASESALNGARAGRLTLSRNETDALLEAVDVIKRQLAELNAGADELSRAEPGLIDRLTALGAETPDTPPGSPHDPSPASEPDPDPNPESEPGPAPHAPASLRPLPGHDQTIRVEVGRLETLMDLVGELVLQKNRIGALTNAASIAGIPGSLAEDFIETTSALDRITAGIQIGVMKIRLQPVERLFGRYPRLVRDLARSAGKEIRIEITGADTEVDKSVIEELGDPLVHLLRNCADHGIEPPDERRSLGKDPTGVIRLDAAHEGSHVRVTIADDGRGLDRRRIVDAALRRGIATPETLDAMSDEAVFRLILEPGFSTADRVSDLSGRGVGLDVVRSNVEHKLKGTLDIDSEPGKGATFSVLIPLTVAIMPAMLVAVGPESYAIPLANVAEIVRESDARPATIATEPVVRVRGDVVPLVDAAEAFGVDPDAAGPRPVVVVLSFNNRLAALRVSRVLGQQDVVIKPLDTVRHRGPVSGATVRNDGGVSLIVDVAELIRRSARAREPRRDAQAHGA